MIIDFKSFQNDKSKIDDYYYCMIIAVSKRARELVDEGFEGSGSPIFKVMEEFENGKFVVEVPDDVF